MFVENQMECRLAGETEILGENLPQRHFWHHKNPHPGLNPGRRGGKLATIIIIIIIIIILCVRLLALRPLLAYCASLG
jgi:hypothetical protein